MKALLKDESAATALEYALMAAAVAAVIITVVFFLGHSIEKTFKDLIKEWDKVGRKS
jgi:Flp pilus assembly pilin Flp